MLRRLLAEPDTVRDEALDLLREESWRTKGRSDRELLAELDARFFSPLDVLALRRRDQCMTYWARLRPLLDAMNFNEVSDD